MQTLTGAQPPAAAVAPQAQAEPEPAVVTPAVSELETQLTALRAERKAAKLDFDHEKDSELTDKIEDLLNEIVYARSAEQVAQVETRNYVSNFNAAVEELEGKYEDALDADPRFETVLNALKTTAEANGDPRIQNPRYILELADEVADMLGYKPGKNTPAPAKKSITPPPAAPARVAKPVGQTAPGHTAVPAISREDAHRLMDGLSDAEMDKLMQIR